jgi:hypothetical protein
LIELFLPLLRIAETRLLPALINSLAKSSERGQAKGINRLRLPATALIPVDTAHPFLGALSHLGERVGERAKALPAS